MLGEEFELEFDYEKVNSQNKKLIDNRRNVISKKLLNHNLEILN